MPFASEKQRRFMHAAAAGRIRKDGPSPEQARSFIRHSGEQPSRTKKLLKRVKGY